jgi:hypothetical protein
MWFFTTGLGIRLRSQALVLVLRALSLIPSTAQIEKKIDSLIE